MIKNMMQQTKRHLAMFLAAAVVVTGLPVMTADAAQLEYVVNGEVKKVVSANSADAVSQNAPQVSGNGCEKFVGWNVDEDTAWESLSDNDVVTATAKFETIHGKTKETITEATCTEDGKIEYTCEVCGETVSDNTVLKATGHKATKATTTPATCGKDGKVEYVCEACGETVSTNTIPATGQHKWDAGKVTKEPTTEAEGVRTYTCSVCGATKTEAIAKVVKKDDEKPVTPTVKLNVKKITLQVKKSTTAVVASGMVKGDKVASWTSSNKKIVTVSKSGKITAKKVGKATITVKTKLGAKATLQVTVQKKAVQLKKISVNKTKVTLKKGKTFKIVATKSPITAQDKVTFKTNNKKVATVTSKGVVKAKKPGKATITVKAGKKTKKVTVTVKK